LRALRAALRCFFFFACAAGSSRRNGVLSGDRSSDAGSGLACTVRIHASTPSFVPMSKPAACPAIIIDFAMPKLRGSESAASSSFAASPPNTCKHASACSHAPSRFRNA
jgi:hypothetical protein